MPLASRAVVRRATAALTAAAAVAAAAFPAAAQFAVPRRTEPARQTASVNLIGIPFGFVSGEYERAIGREGLAFGLGGLVSFDNTDLGDAIVDYSDDDRFASLQAKLKYYPAARGLRGFAVGVTAGVASVRGTTRQFTGTVPVQIPGGGTGFQSQYQESRVSDTRPTVGTVVDYNFLLGARQRFLVGIGLGARRVLGSRPDYAGSEPYLGYRPGLDQTLFDGRFQIGFAF